MNAQLATDILQKLLSLGVQEFCVCPGARNAPLIAVLSSNPEKFQTYYFFEERSASFFALGRIRRTGRPVAVITTSGTAAGELLPATMEAHYSGLPLILMTADRPRRYRNSGAPQTAEQVNLYGVYVSQSLDIEYPESPNLDFISFDRPFHLNCCFDEPLLETAQSDLSPYQIVPTIEKSSSFRNKSFESAREVDSNIIDFLGAVQYPLVIVGMLHPSEREAVAQLLLKWRVPTYFEGLSGLREEERFRDFQIYLSDRIIERAYQSDYPIDGVVRIGGVPTLRLWRDLDLKHSNMKVLSLSRLPFSGLGRPSHFVNAPIQGSCQEILKILKSQAPKGSEWMRRFLELDHQIMNRLETLLKEEPLSEPGMIAALSRRISTGSSVYLGNSLPIREWDLAATNQDRKFDVWGSRGLNGIDGQVSTFLGFAVPQNDNWAILGDLTALYDLPGPWILSQLSQIRVSLVVVNNEGGKIFSRMFSQPEFQNQHRLRFGSWAELWGLQYEKWNEVPEQVQETQKSRLIEMLPDEEATQRFWKKYQKLFETL